MEATQTYTDRWMDKQNALCTYSGILFSPKKGWNSDTHCSIGEPWKHYAKWNKLNKKVKILYGSPYMGIIWGSKFIETESRK